MISSISKILPVILCLFLISDSLKAEKRFFEVNENTKFSIGGDYQVYFQESSRFEYDSDGRDFLLQSSNHRLLLAPELKYTDGDYKWTFFSELYVLRENISGNNVSGSVYNDSDSGKAKLSSAGALLVGPWFIAQGGLVKNHVGAGLLANSGNKKSKFDYGYDTRGDSALRGLFAVSPGLLLGSDEWWRGIFIGGGYDKIVDDELVERLPGGKAQSLNMVLTLRDGEGHDVTLGYVERNIEDEDNHSLLIKAFDLSWYLEFPIDGEGSSIIETKGELIKTDGKGDLINNLGGINEMKINQFAAFIDVGLKSPEDENYLKYGLSFMLASGDKNPYDDFLSSFRGDPDFSFGMLFMPIINQEMLYAEKMQARDPNISNVPVRGSNLLDPMGGVTNVIALRPYIEYQYQKGFFTSFGLILASLDQPFNAPFEQVKTGANANFLGHITNSRDLGLEADLLLGYEADISAMNLIFRVGSAYFWPGDSLKRADGTSMGNQSMWQADLTLEF